MRQMLSHALLGRSQTLALLVLAGGWASQAGAAPFGVGYREATGYDVPANVTTNQTEPILISEGMLNKTGDGSLALAASNLMVQSGGSLTVRGGTFVVGKDAATNVAPAACPYDVLANAAFWVDATTNVVAVSSNDNAYADVWLDARETNTVAPFRFTRAVANWSFTNCSPQVVVTNTGAGAKPVLWFGRYNSLRTMTWTTPNNATADITKIYHVFAVNGVFLSYGYIFGTMGGDPDFHINEYTAGTPTSTIWHPTEWTTTAVRQGRTYLNGERVDGTITSPKSGWQLLEVAMATKLPHAANFFNDRNITAYGKRIGGDYLAEVVVFTNRLSETERLRVQQYLMQKWIGVKAIAPLEARSSAAGTVAADVATNCTMTVRVNGDGTFQKLGPGRAVLDDVASISNLFRSAVVQAGTLDLRVPVPLAVAAGSRVTTSNTAITVAQDAGAGQITKEGTGTVTVTSLPADLARLSVNGGLLVLAPPSVATTCVAVVTGSVPNATFEAEQLTSYRRGLVNGETYYGWTAYFPAPTGSADNAVFVFNRSADATKWPCDYEAPEGKQVLALKQDASVSTTLTLPLAGVYDVSFYTSARSFLSGRHEFDLYVVDGTESNRVATVQTINQAYARQSFRLPWLAAGAHTLLLKRTAMGVDTCGTIDDVRVTLASETKPTTIKVPNGDFELTAYPRDPTAFATSNLAPGWTFTAATNGEVSAALAMAASSAYVYTPSTPYGAVMLGLASNGCAWTSFTLPAGTYKLQGDLCNWPCSINNKTLQGVQSVKATITRGAGDSATLGTLSTLGASVLTTTAWPTAFTVTNNETVVLTLAGQTTTGLGLIDNLVLVPQTNAIVQNGSFEVSANWTFSYNSALQPKDNATYNNIAASNDYGLAFYQGTQRLLLVQTGIAYQDIQIPTAGLYRLVFHAAQRTPLTYGNTYGHNPVRAWLAQNGTTNVIGWTRVDDVALVRREFLFSVAAAGTYRFGLQGMTDNSAQFPGTDQNALIDGVSIDPATDLAPAGVPLPRKLALSVAKGAGLQLSYVGTQTVDIVAYDGRMVSGVISQATHPEFVSGLGALYAAPKGTLFFLR